MNYSFQSNYNKCKRLVRKILNKIPSEKIRNFILDFPTEMQLSKNLDLLINKQYKGERFFIFPSPSSPWGYMFQRPQQLARALSSQGHLVLYSVDTSFPEDPDWSTRGLFHLEDNIYLFNDGTKGRSLSYFADRMIIWQYWPHQYEGIEYISTQDTIRIMDCIDHISTFLPYDSILDDYRKSIEKAHIVLATSNSIYEDVKKLRSDCIVVPNGVNTGDFTTNRKHKMSIQEEGVFNEVILLKEKGNILVGYYGAIAEWIDFELIDKISKENPQWQFVFIGEKYPNIEFPDNDNIHFFERVSYEALLNIVKSFDVAILPFKINDITINTSPVKIFEYMAAQKPIVSTPLPEVFKYEPIFVAEGSEDFENKLQQAIKSKNDENYLRSLEQCSAMNTWESRAKQVVSELHKRRHI